MSGPRGGGAGQRHAGGLQVDDDPRLQVRIWRIQRAGWMGFALVIAAALAGLTGQGGPLAGQSVGAAGVTVELPRVVRRSGEPWAVTVRRIPEAAGADGGPGELVVTLGPEVIAALEILDVLPAAEERALPGGGVALRVAADGADRAEVQRPEPHVLRLIVRARRAGPVVLRLGVDGSAVTARLFILP